MHEGLALYFDYLKAALLQFGLTLSIIPIPQLETDSTKLGRACFHLDFVVVECLYLDPYLDH